jgi:hypothetical protein
MRTNGEVTGAQIDHVILTAFGMASRSSEPGVFGSASWRRAGRGFQNLGPLRVACGGVLLAVSFLRG